MTYDAFYNEKLENKLSKIAKRNPKLLRIINKKIREIRENPHHYKPLQGELKGLRRVHIDTHFVLTFEIDDFEKKIILYDFDHHDKIY